MFRLSRLSRRISVTTVNRFARLTRASSKILLIASVLLTAVSSRAQAPWNPAEWKDVEVLEIRTVAPEEGEHWSKLWMVVIDDEVYLRLGSRAVERIQENVDRPIVSVRIDGQEFGRIAAIHAPDFRDRVAEAMSKKYWTDFLARILPHPMTVRLTPADD